MKKTILLSILAFIGECVIAQNIKVTICYEEIQKERGELYQYSERYLGTTDAVLQSETLYRFVSVSIHDTINTVKKSPLKHDISTKHNSTQIAPLCEEALMATNTSKKAESVAKQIYRIREAKMNILSGESEQRISDLKVAIKELDKMERSLVSLFVGKTITEKKTKEVDYIIPDSCMMTDSREILCRFSKYAGPVDSDDFSGEAIYLIRAIETELKPTGTKKHIEFVPHVVKNNVSIEYNGQIILNQDLKQ